MFLKTKDMCIDFQKNHRCPKPVCIEGESVAKVEIYKYLFAVLGCKLRWKENTSTVLKKSELENVLLQKPAIFWVNTGMLVTFYNVVTCSLIMFGSVCWGGNISKFDGGRLEKIVLSLWKAGPVGEKDCTKTNANIKWSYTPGETLLWYQTATGLEDFYFLETNTNSYNTSFLLSALSIFDENMIVINPVCVCVSTSAEDYDFQRLSKGGWGIGVPNDFI